MTVSNQDKDELRENIEEEQYQEWLNQPPIQFPLCPDSPIRNDYSNTSSLQDSNGGNQIEVGMDDYLRDTIAMETMLLDASKGYECHCDHDHLTKLSPWKSYPLSNHPYQPLFDCLHCYLVKN